VGKNISRIGTRGCDIKIGNQAQANYGGVFKFKIFQGGAFEMP